VPPRRPVPSGRSQRPASSRSLRFRALSRTLRAGAVAVGLWPAAACTSGPETIDRDVFVATYVDLRVAALDTDSALLAAPDREAILQRHGVTEADLTTFAEVHAAELEFMRDVWAEVETAMDREPGADAGSDPNG